jgi:hypothetical protein
VLIGAQHRLGQLLEQFGGAALDDAGRPADRQVGRLLSGRVGARIVTATRGSRRTLRVFWYSARCADTSSSPSGVDSSAIQTTDTCGLPSGLTVTNVASVPAPMSSRAVSSSFMWSKDGGLGRFIPGYAASRVSSADLAAAPPTYWPVDPSDRTTR